MANEIYDSTWWGNTIQTASSIGTSTEMIQGQFNLTRLGDEEVINGDFSSDSDWAKGSGWSINNGKAVSDGSGNYQSISQSCLVSPIGKTYKVTYEVSDYVSGEVRCILGGFTLGQIISSNGLVTEYLTVSNASSNTFVYLETRGSGFTGSIDNVSVKEVGQDWDLGTGWIIGEDKAISDATQGLISQTNVSGAGVTAIYKVQWTQNITAGTRLRFFARNYNDGGTITTLSITRDDGTSMGCGNCVGSGTFTAYVSSTNGYSFKMLSETGVEADITNISVKEVGQDWTFGTGWSIGEDKAVNDGTINQSLLQTNVFTIGKSYKINFTISDVVSSLDARIWMATGGAKIEANANGNYTTYWEADGTDLYTTTLSTNTATYSISNISVKEITDDTNIPRINYEGFSYQDSLGSEEVVNGGFDDGSAGWNVAGGNPIFENSSVNFVNFSTINSNNTVVELGKTYKITYTISNKVGNSSFGFFLGGWNVAQYQDVGTHSEIISVSSSSVIYIRNGDSNSSVTIDNVSV